MSEKLPALKDCPFCGKNPYDREKPIEAYDYADGYKWGAVYCVCGAMSPDVRTEYAGEVISWASDAAREWNTRIINGETPQST